MRKNIRSLSEAAGKLALKVDNALPEDRAHEVRLTTLGGIAGTIGGATLVGGMGLAALGTAIPLAGFAVAGVSCAIIGNKIGSELDRRKSAKRQANNHF